MKLFKALGLGLLATALAAGAAGAQTKTIKIATEGAYAPWNFTGAGGKLEGFEVDLAADLCKRMNVTCEVVAQDWDGIIPALNAKKYDAIMAGMNITDKRLEAINFSRSYASGLHGFGAMKDSPLAKLAGTGQRLNLDKDAEAAKKTIEEWKPILKGKTIGVQGSTTNSAFLEKYLKDTITIREYKTTEQHDLDLAAGRVDGIFAAQSSMKATLDQPEFKDMAMMGAGMSGDVLGRGVAVGLRKDDAELKKNFDTAIQAAIADGTIQKLTEKWFKVDMTPQS
ncbi:lysine/arginine/ornithine ABC transporter substrate-binding protein [Microvirga pudoricolor]|uniref:lysine/arginine/ornithine ABC transporter substrate-binding protein n=1 Tax=Microvirga pudoricolor TaxID=2778729 RepID=UPI001950C3B5|nr:lysine/arginine/ornithine ABC transporter substrate-binding protein [Microvirga pudoricolor]MBM6592811.1 transporter substrate-binding domain-containing protein [Microvirga pudoricolor]